jgi:hypothetical protein
VILRVPARARATVTLAAVVASVSAAVPAVAADGADEARAKGTCGAGARMELRLEADDGRIEIEVDVDTRRGRAPWRVVLVHERRVAWKGAVRTRSGGSFELRRRVTDLPGADTVSARAWGPAGVTCRAAATLGR